jgi:DNA invertase Pin-like site-specific DNA recombinase
MGAKVYSYLRFSDARQAAGASSERQLSYAKEWAAKHGLQLDEQLSLRDEGLSAYHQRHVKKGALGAFLAAVEARQVERGSVLIVEGLDRLSRAEPLLAQAQLTSIIDAGISVVTASDGKVYSREHLKAQPMDLVYSLLVMIRAHEESDTKSKRVRDAIRRQVAGWKAGTYRGLIRYGKTPGWLRVAGGRWEHIPERVAAVRAAVDMSLRGLGTGHIARELHAAGLAIGTGVPTSGHLTRLLVHPALIGEKHLELDGETHVLAGYYPPAIDAGQWRELQEALALRGRKAVKGDIPSVLTGLGITVCGYCAAPLKAQTMANKRREDGTLADGHRRLQCTRVNAGNGCSMPGSCSAAPIERALMSYCSDVMNLRALFRGDAAAVPRAELASAQAKLAEVDAKLERLTAALLDVNGPAPTTFARLARELEAERAGLADDVQRAEGALSAAARADVRGADERWRALASGVDALDHEARMQARQLVADTFERIVVFRAGIRPEETPAGEVDLILTAKGSTAARALRVDRRGGWIAADLAVATTG